MNNQEARGTWRTLALAGALLSAGAATAQPEAAVPADRPPARAAVAVPGFGKPAVSSERLAGQRGGSVTTTVDQDGRLSDATARNVTTGNNAVRDGAFANAIGLNTVIQNSGANVLIQNSMTVNVQMK